MSSPCRELRRRSVPPHGRLVLWRFAPAVALCVGLGTAVAQTPEREHPTVANPAPLRVCADPDNLPYSRRDGSGFENRIAMLVAAELRRSLEYAWQPQRRGFLRKTLGAGHCDLLVGVPADLQRVVTTRPYYRSSYVFLTVAADPAPLRSFEDPRLADLRVGVQLIGDDLAATPPGHALARRGATEHVVGFTVEGDGPAAARMAYALGAGQLDAALVWGPQAGWFARRSAVPLHVEIARAPADGPAPFEFDIAFGVRPGDLPLRDAVDAAIDARRADIDAVLAAYGVPRTDRTMVRAQLAPPAAGTSAETSAGRSAGMSAESTP